MNPWLKFAKKLDDEKEDVKEEAKELGQALALRKKGKVSKKKIADEKDDVDDAKEELEEEKKEASMNRGNKEHDVTRTLSKVVTGKPMQPKTYRPLDTSNRKIVQGKLPMYETGGVEVGRNGLRKGKGRSSSYGGPTKLAPMPKMEKKAMSLKLGKKKEDSMPKEIRRGALGGAAMGAASGVAGNLIAGRGLGGALGGALGGGMSGAAGGALHGAYAGRLRKKDERLKKASDDSDRKKSIKYQAKASRRIGGGALGALGAIGGAAAGGAAGGAKGALAGGILGGAGAGALGYGSGHISGTLRGHAGNALEARLNKKASKSSEKRAFLTTGIGYGLGHMKAKDMVKNKEKMPDVGAGTVAGSLLVPGGLGYNLGKRITYHNEMKNKKSLKKKKKKK